MPRRLEIAVSGIVQGVGFRPHVYRLAERLHLDGSVKNNSRGVSIEVQGNPTDTHTFLEQLQSNPPPLAQITEINVRESHPGKQAGFHIIESAREELPTAFISPDVAVCDDCLDELFDPNDRRYHYPFINCTNCGPRYTIVGDIPYDRGMTSMAEFTMCERCQKEYDNPTDRRFHAQPNACPECGPHLRFHESNGKRIPGDPITMAVTALEMGCIVAIKGLGGFHLAVDATNDRSVRELRSRKHRFEKPLALMVVDVLRAKRIAHINTLEASHILSPQRPIVLCKKKKGSPIANAVAPDNDHFGLMAPYSPLHALLFELGNIDYLVMTSANLSEEPICYQNEECFERVSHITDYCLTYNRDILVRCDDSVLHISNGTPLFIRRSRGFAPAPIVLNQEGPSVLAVGGNQKNTVCLTRNNNAFLSQHIGDLENLETLTAFEEAITHLQKLFEIEPEHVIHDRHPEYLSTKWTQEQERIPRHGIQHHYAHILSVMAENGIEDTVIGIAMDGAGYGTDGNIWGGEALICNTENFDRFAHFEYVPMPGGEMAIKQPWRMAISHMLCSLEDGETVAHQIFCDKKTQVETIIQMCRKKINSPLTSSCGRLFDAVAAILGLNDSVAYEGQAAIMLEAQAASCEGASELDIGEFELFETADGKRISARQVVEKIVKHACDHVPTPKIARAFHEALIDIFAKTACEAYEKTGLTDVALSGGCFQNRILLEGLKTHLHASGFTVFTNQKVPVNDGGIALGQAYWGLCNLK